MSFEYKSSEAVLRELVDVDGHLTIADRKELASAIGRAEMNALTFDWGGTIGCFAGFIYLYKYKPQKYLGTPGRKVATYGTLLLGSMLMSAGSHVYFASRLVNQFQGQEYPHKAARLVATSNLALWWAYYKMTAEEPQNSLSNPKMLENMEERLKLKKGTLTSLPPTPNQVALPKTEADKEKEADERPWKKLASDSFGNSKDDIWGEEPEAAPEQDTNQTRSWDEIRKDAGVKQGSWNKPAAAPKLTTEAGIPQIPASQRPNGPQDPDSDGLGLAQAEFDRQLDLERQGYKSNDDFAESEKKWK